MKSTSNPRPNPWNIKEWVRDALINAGDAGMAEPDAVEPEPDQWEEEGGEEEGEKCEDPPLDVS